MNRRHFGLVVPPQAQAYSLVVHAYTVTPWNSISPFAFQRPSPSLKISANLALKASLLSPCKVKTWLSVLTLSQSPPLLSHCLNGSFSWPIGVEKIGLAT